MKQLKTVYVSLASTDGIKRFVDILSKYAFNATLVSERYKVDAKSILAIFSLDLTQPLRLEIHSDSCDGLLDELRDFLTDEA